MGAKSKWKVKLGTGNPVRTSQGKDVIQATPETMARALESRASLNFKQYYKKEADQKQQTLNITATTGYNLSDSSQIKHPTINYALCFAHFDDVVLINPINIDSCNIEDNYIAPSKCEIRNAYFKQVKHT